MCVRIYIYILKSMHVTSRKQERRCFGRTQYKNNSSLMSLSVQTASYSNLIQQFLPDAVEPWTCCKAKLLSVQVWVVLWGRSIQGTATLTLVPHSSLQSCPKSCDVPVMSPPVTLLPFHVVMLPLWCPPFSAHSHSSLWLDPGCRHA